MGCVLAEDVDLVLCAVADDLHMVVEATLANDADFFGDGLDEVAHSYSPVMMSMSCVPRMKDPPRVRKANKGTTPCSFMPQKPMMIEAMSMMDKRMWDKTAVGFMVFSLLLDEILAVARVGMDVPRFDELPSCAVVADFVVGKDVVVHDESPVGQGMEQRASLALAPPRKNGDKCLRRLLKGNRCAQLSDQGIELSLGYASFNNLCGQLLDQSLGRSHGFFLGG